jgi:hypothetical protein
MSAGEGARGKSFTGLSRPGRRAAWLGRGVRRCHPPIGPQGRLKALDRSPAFGKLKALEQLKALEK